MTTTFPPFPPPPTGAPPGGPTAARHVAAARAAAPAQAWHRVVACIAGLGALVTVALGLPVSLVDVAARTTTRTSRTVAGRLRSCASTSTGAAA